MEFKFDYFESMKPEHEKFMKQAIQLASDNVRQSKGKPFGAVIVKDGNIISSGVNEVLKTHDPTTHAELQAIRAASLKLNTENLSGCIVYASGHPCPMCLSACLIAGISEIYYYNTMEDETSSGFDVSAVYEQVGKKNEERKYPLKHLKIDEAESPFKVWESNRNK